MRKNVVIPVVILCLCVFWFGYGIYSLSTNSGVFSTNIFSYTYQISEPVSSDTVRGLAAELSTNPYVIQMPLFELVDSQGYVTQSSLVVSNEIQDADTYGLILSNKQTEIRRVTTPAGIGCIVVAFSFVLGLFSACLVGYKG